MNTIKRTSRSESKWSIVQNTAMKSVAVLVLLHLAIGNEINTSQTAKCSNVSENDQMVQCNEFLNRTTTSFFQLSWSKCIFYLKCTFNVSGVNCTNSSVPTDLSSNVSSPPASKTPQNTLTVFPTSRKTASHYSLVSSATFIIPHQVSITPPPNKTDLESFTNKFEGPKSDIAWITVVALLVAIEIIIVTGWTCTCVIMKRAQIFQNKRKQETLQIDTLCFSQGNPSYSLGGNDTQDPEYETIAPKDIETRVSEDGGAQGMKDRHGGVDQVLFVIAMWLMK